MRGLKITKQVGRPDTPLAATPEPSGTYYATSKGRVGRLSSSTIGGNISSVQNESIDTTGYSKGKKDFTKTTYRTFQKPTAQKINREDVLPVVSRLKKESKATEDSRLPSQKKKNKI